MCSVVSDSFVTVWTVALDCACVCVRAHLLVQMCINMYGGHMGFLRQKYWSGLPVPSAGDLSGPGVEPVSCIAGGSFTA